MAHGTLSASCQWLFAATEHNLEATPNPPVSAGGSSAVGQPPKDRVVTPFDKAIANIARVGYHNQRREDHSDIVSESMFQDLLARCSSLREDFAGGVVAMSINAPSPGDRLRKADLLVAEPGADGRPDIDKVRIAV